MTQVQGIMKGEPDPTKVVLPNVPNPNNPNDPRNPGYREKALMKRNLMIGAGILLLIGLVMSIKKYPKATIGTIATLFLLLYFFMPNWFSGGGSRFQQWMHRNDKIKGGGPTMAGRPVMSNA